MKKKNNKKWTLVLVLLLVVSIGYAALASNLKINGTTGVKSATWDVYWNNVQVTQGSVETTQGNQARITDQAKTQVEYSVTLNEPGDFYEFTVDAVNNGTIDAMIEERSIVKGVYSDSEYENETTLPDAIKYTVTYADGTAIADKHLLAKKTNGVATTETYKVRIEYRNDNDVDPEDLEEVTNQTYYFKFSVNYVQADDSKIARNGGSNNNQNGDPELVNFTMDEMCPGCFFAGNTETAGTLNSDFILRNSNSYSSFIIEDYNDWGENFLGYILDDNVIKRAFACGHSDVGYFCIEGTTDGSKYERNIKILRHFYPDCDIDSSSSEIACGEAYIESNGYAETDGYYHCMVSNPDDGIICY